VLVRLSEDGGETSEGSVGEEGKANKLPDAEKVDAASSFLRAK